MSEGTDLYHWAMACEGPHQEIMREVWSPTPWMVEVYTGPTADDRDFQIREWCRACFGPEASPIHGHAGDWQRGSATVNGWTWFGFATRELMEHFLSEWPQETSDA